MEADDQLPADKLDAALSKAEILIKLGRFAVPRLTDDDGKFVFVVALTHGKKVGGKLRALARGGIQRVSERVVHRSLVGTRLLGTNYLAGKIAVLKYTVDAVVYRLRRRFGGRVGRRIRVLFIAVAGDKTGKREHENK